MTDELEPLQVPIKTAARLLGCCRQTLYKMIDEKMRALIDLVRSEGGRMCQSDSRLDPYADDRGDETDTFNRCVKAGLLKAWACSWIDDGFVKIVE